MIASAARRYLRWVFQTTEEANRRALLSALPASRGGALLDIGTHTGDFTLRLAARIGAQRVCGVELIPAHAEAARGRGVEVVTGDVDDVGLPFDDRSFDLVHANQVIEHVRRTDRLLAEIRRVLAPGGLAYVSTNNLAGWHNVGSLALGFQPPPMHVSDELIVGNPLDPEHGRRHEDRGRTHLRLFTARALTELAAHHGLRARRVRTVGWYPLPPVLAAAATRIDPRHGAFLLAVLERDRARGPQPRRSTRSAPAA